MTALFRAIAGTFLIMEVNRVYFPTEQKLATWSSLLLTTHRVISGVTSGSTSLLIHQVTGTAIAKKDNPTLLVAAALCGLTGLVLQEGAPRAIQFNGLILGVVVAALFVAGYYASRETVVEIHGTDGRKLTCKVQGLDPQAEARRFIDAVERVACMACRGPERLPQVDPRSGAPDLS